MLNGTTVHSPADTVEMTTTGRRFVISDVFA